MSALPGWATLLCAILLEVLGTSALKASDQLTRALPVVVMGACYVGAFYFLSLTLRTMAVGVAYAIWSGLGIVLISLVGLLAFGQRLDTAAVAGMALIVAGVLVINLLSRSAGA